MRQQQRPPKWCLDLSSWWSLFCKDAAAAAGGGGCGGCDPMTVAAIEPILMLLVRCVCKCNSGCLGCLCYRV